MGAWYRAGTVSITSGSKNVVGVDTYFVLNASIGDIFTIDGNRVYEIETVTDNTHLALKTAFGETTVSGANYGICRNFTGTTNATLAEKLTILLNSWQAREDEFANWLAGTANGGTNGDGKYPLTNAIGQTLQVNCPAKIATGVFTSLAVASASGDVLSTIAFANSAAQGASAIVKCGNGTTSARYAYSDFISSETSGAEWRVGLHGTKDLVMRDQTNNRDVFTISQSTGNVLIGTTTSFGGKLDVLATDTGTTNVSVSAILAHSTSNVPADGFGAALLFAMKRTDNNVAAASQISSCWEGTPSAGTEKADLRFSTTFNSSIVERVRVTAGGNVLVGTATDNGSGAKLQVGSGLTLTSDLLLLGTDGFIKGGAVSGRCIISNSDISTYMVMYGSTHATLAGVLDVVASSTAVGRWTSTGLIVTGSTTTSTGFGCNGKTAQTAYTVNAASTDLSTVVALCNQLRTALINNGICV
jgi:hypothetical protein